MRTPCDHRPLSQPIETRVCSSCAVRFPKGSSPLHFPTRSDVVERSIVEQGRNAFENTIELFLGLCASGRSTRRTLSVVFFFFPFLFFFSSFSLFFFCCPALRRKLVEVSRTLRQTARVLNVSLPRVLAHFFQFSISRNRSCKFVRGSPRCFT